MCIDKRNLERQGKTTTMSQIVNIPFGTEILDVVDENGVPTGETVTREKAHEEGIRHRTSHVWLLREKDGILQILVQKRSDDKDSFPGCYDISSAGHIPAGSGYEESAIRELEEELGVKASEKDLVLCGQRQFSFEKEFYGKMFRDCQVTNVYICFCDAGEEDFILQESEISEVRWFEMNTLRQLVETNGIEHCIYTEELDLVEKGARKALAREHQFRLIDAAARGSIEAAADLAEGYYKGTFGDAPNMKKALKWANYAAKRGSIKAAEILSDMKG